MYKRKIIDEVSVNEMIQMRESGMSNAEVAQALDVSYSTVLNYLARTLPARSASARSTVLQKWRPLQFPPQSLKLRRLRLRIPQR